MFNPRFYFIATTLCCTLFAAGLWTSRPQLAAPPAFTAYGYGGPIHMTMELTDNGTITSLQVTQHDETPSYVGRLEDFLARFIGKPRENQLILGRDIDAISGATITSDAITEGVRKERALILKTPQQEERIPALNIEYIILPLLLIVAATIAFCYRHNPLRWAVMIGSTFYFGIINHSMLSILQITQAGLGKAPDFSQNTLWWMFLIIGILSAFLIGRVYCGSLCPFASIQEILFMFKSRRADTTPVITPVIDKYSRLIKYILLLILMSLALYLNSGAIANIEPFITLFAGHGSKLAWAFLAFMLVLAIFNYRFWCKYLCPVGALTGLAAVFSFFKIKPRSTCNGCGDCARICPTEAITSDKKGIPAIDMAECINCAKCLRACPVNALMIKGGFHD
ncbi:MAG: FMN-binding protein [Candidatus Omnitrophica bacterium]|nr:FMN-binding protein [Candidatus Omnitrophota bacterium]